MVSRTELRKALVTYFNEDEIKTLCIDLGIDYENLSGTTKEARARELIDLLERHNRTQDLIAACSKERPTVQWRELIEPAAVKNALEQQAHSVATKRIPQSGGPPHPISAYTVRRVPVWAVIFATPVAWLVGHFVSLASTGVTALTPFLMVGTVGGAISSLLITWLGLSITDSLSRTSFGQIGRISLYFLVAGLLSGFVGLTLWLFGCAFETTSVIRQFIGCYDSSNIIWKLGAGFSSLIGLAGANILMLIEFGATRLLKPKQASENGQRY